MPIDWRVWPEGMTFLEFVVFLYAAIGLIVLRDWFGMKLLNWIARMRGKNHD